MNPDSWLLARVKCLRTQEAVSVMFPLKKRGSPGLADGVRQGFETQNMFECDMRQVRCMCLSYLFD